MLSKIWGISAEFWRPIYQNFKKTKTFQQALQSLQTQSDEHKLYCGWVCVCVCMCRTEGAWKLKEKKKWDTHSSSYQGNRCLSLSSLCFIIGRQRRGNVVWRRLGENPAFLVVKVGCRKKTARFHMQRQEFYQHKGIILISRHNLIRCFMLSHWSSSGSGNLERLRTLKKKKNLNQNFRTNSWLTTKAMTFCGYGCCLKTWQTVLVRKRALSEQSFACLQM